ncbi:ankyrin repeat-containing protein At5g02620-like [Macadamia integrifolia]|uniref:ankyrin repeat-containing protein At5g02620-like n=1 Tax=Macadamia integrifolia TaxID=60698 RepID=UPI001C52B4DC|nr:ankyrin repeat-containing protein At5g02620-like [Macadamia integrifolia]
MMIRRLYEASVSGSLPSLIELIEEDELILDRIMVTHLNETPIHIAAMLGHVEFAKEILRRKPELATELNSESSSPLHLASARGNLEMVKELLTINPNVCFVTDHDGRTPLHLAVIKGRIDIMKELIQKRPEVIHVRVDRGETIIHLCLKYNRLEELKVLLESAGSDQELINSKDDDGNTALHLAAAKKQTKAIELLLDKNGVEVNALNGSGLTTLDILAQSPREMKDMDIGESLRAAGALRARDIIIVSAVNENDRSKVVISGRGKAIFSSSQKNTRTSGSQMKSKEEWLERKKNSLMVVSTVIATMAFQAILNPPGGVWQDYGTHPDPYNPSIEVSHRAGTSVMADDSPFWYLMFLIFCTLSFVGSLSITLLLISGLPLRRRVFMWILMVIMWIIITSLVLALIVSISQQTPNGDKFNLIVLSKLVTPKVQFNLIIEIMVISVTIWLGLLGLVLLLHTVRFVFLCVKKCWKTTRPVRRRPQIINNDQSQSYV